MDDTQKAYKIFFSSAEPSGDRLCAKLISALNKSNYNFECTGFGGPNMAQAGCSIILNTTERAAMTYNAFGQVFFFYKAIKRAKTFFSASKPDLVVVCDSPSFNFHIAKAAKNAGIKTFFYVAPQLWAWAEWRIKKLKSLCTSGLAAILPFEPEWFAARGLECKFVGNPLLEDINSDSVIIKNYKNFSISKAHIALMPGSRSAEIKSLWPPMLQIARKLKARHPGIKITVVATNEKIAAQLRSTEIKSLRCEYSIDTVFNTARKVDFTFVASGSATLQVAAAACPMVIMYQSSKFLWNLIGKRIVKTKYLSLVNILSQKELVPEFMPYFDSTAPIANTAESLLKNPDKLNDLSEALAELTKPIIGLSASQNTAEMIIEQLIKSQS
ncbi:MAG: lipid-A-disaccharide synthase [Planctomycetes bacterium GWF2_41_51]|nr:MAG: lipid-A-disaccharide synthase [Planctomycetes bacterium GWF2_41_51]HBG28450.1 lipid-A-disaccharide synthase [Phycisphaerales bacterium]